jgi:predicted nicotinamide N-methyase
MLNHSDFIQKYTKLQYLSFVPEIRLFTNKEKTMHDMLKQELGNNTARPYWTQSWAGGLALSRYVIDNPDTVKNKHVIDFCSGSGIVGIAAAMSGAARVTCIDNDTIALSSSLLNARANKVSIDVSETIIEGDILLAGDPEVKAGIFDIIKNTGSYIGCPTRNKSYLDKFDTITSYVIDTEEFPNSITYILSSAHLRPRGN